MSSRTWFKIYADKWLSGSMREESPEIRGIFVDLLALAADGKYGDIGEIKLRDGVGYSQNQLKSLLNTSDFLLKKALNRLQTTERIAIKEGNVIQIINWKKYQSEYERQRPYRNPKLQRDVTTNGYSGERERDRDRDKKVTTKSYKVVN